ncbi:MAG: hypothetical protein CVT88_02375 [Candidatus Altiarchaeales archaeon HGW-Altiarchaeales-1]|nr:MAG: hypothetical protein CVT88_02375 [Candidatus Altiarchaeales archaeon HGW-Altiarchaeales-1]
MRPVIEIELESNNGLWISANAIVDTGADYTTINEKYASVMGIDLNNLKEANGKGIGGKVTGHFAENVKIKINDQVWNIPVFFLNFPLNLVGRRGILETYDLLFTKNYGEIEIRDEVLF